MAPPLGVITLSLLLLVLLTGSSCARHDFIVADFGDGWVAYPDEPQDHFHINDTLVFKYDKDVDAVLWVSQSHYDTCNTTEPLVRLDGGNSRITFSDTGYLYFISADATRCRDGGERLIAFVRQRLNNTLQARS